MGERPVGIQASQLAAIARWAKHQRPDADVEIIAISERMSLAALLAASLETKAIDRVELRGSLATLKQVVEQNYAVNQKPEFFCFGLLEAFADLRGDLRASILIALQERAASTNISELSRLCGVTRLAVVNAVDDLELSRRVTCQREGRSRQVQLAA